MTNKLKLELTWIGKENRPRLEPRVLVEERERSYHAAKRVTAGDQFDNRLIFGDNLLALKALEQEFAGKVKCIYIDPPFNTGEMFEHYDDGLEHSLWLTQMRDRMEILHRLLSVDGSLFVHIDDNELGYLIAICDEIFGRKNRVNIVTFKQSSASGPKAINPGLVTTANYLIFYSKDKTCWNPNKIYQAVPRDDRYNSFVVNIEDHFSEWRFSTLRDAFANRHNMTWEQVRVKFAERLESELSKFVIKCKNSVFQPALVRDKDINEEARAALIQSRNSPDKVFCSERSDKDNYYFLNGKQLLFYKNKVKNIGGIETSALAASNIWDDLLSNNVHQEGGVSFPKGKKPEALIERVLSFTTMPGDLVLDSFAGSGTTGAVAHKMGRRWIMVELGEHCHTHIIPRMKKVIDGADPGGITEAAGWKGGGGFRYYRLAPSLLEKDKWGNWIVSRQYNGAMLAEAMCKHEGFTYAPSETDYWQQGHSSERDFIYVTTQSLNRAQLAALSEEVGPKRSLLVCCAAFQGKAGEFPNLTVKKIPNAVLNRCEWGRDDYSLEIKALPSASPAPQEEPAPARGTGRKGKGTDAAPTLFEGKEAKP